MLRLQQCKTCRLKSLKHCAVSTLTDHEFQVNPSASYLCTYNGVCSRHFCPYLPWKVWTWSCYPHFCIHINSCNSSLYEWYVIYIYVTAQFRHGSNISKSFPQHVADLFSRINIMIRLRQIGITFDADGISDLMYILSTENGSDYPMIVNYMSCNNAIRIKSSMI